MTPQEVEDPRGDADRRGVVWALEELRLAEARLDRRRLGRASTARERAATRFVLERADQESPATPRDLALHLGISQSTASELIARLVADGVLTTRQHPRDGRSKVLSPVSRHDHLDGQDSLTDEIRTAVGRLTDREAETVQGFLEHLRELVDRADRS